MKALARSPMLRHRQPFTLLATALALAGAAFAWQGDMAVAAVLLFLAHGCVLLEFKKYTGRYQFILVPATALLLGAVLDVQYGSFPWMSIAMLLSGAATDLRQRYMPVFTYVAHLWVEPVVLAVAIGCYGHVVCAMPFQWQADLLPWLPMGFAGSLSFGYVQDGRLLRKAARKGYRVQVGMPAPDLELPDVQGALVRLRDHRGRHPVLLIFVRGDWCPGCHMMLRTYERHRERFLERNVHVVAVGPDSVEVNRDMVERIGVSYQLLSDRDQSASRRYGVVYENPLIELGVDYAAGIPLPASFLLDRDGTVRYVSRPDRVGEFLDPSLIFGVLDQLPLPEKAGKAA